MTLTQTPATKVTKCSECPFARHIDGNRYCCTEAKTRNDVVRGHWEPRTDCLGLWESIAPEPANESEPIEPTAAVIPAPATPATASHTATAPAIIPAATKTIATKKLMLSIVPVKRMTSDISAGNFDRNELEIAAELSLAIGGFCTPPVVRREGSGYRVVSGHFQYHAAAHARQLDPRAGENIPAIVLEPETEAPLLAQLEMLKLRR